MPRETRFPTLATAAMAVPALMIATGHPALGVAALGAVLAGWVAHATIEGRATRARLTELDRSPTVSLSSIDAPRWAASADDDDLFYPADNDERWVHLRPSDY